jgi:type IV pilus assembly protein PilW
MKYLQPCQFSADQTRCMVKTLSRQHGLTLIELMISIVLGLFLVGGVLSIFVSTNQTSKLNDNLMRVQENARSAFDLMARDIREAGQNPCGARKNIVNVLRASGTIPVWTDWNLGTLRGYDDTEAATGIEAFGTTVAARVSGTDAFLIIRADAAEKSIESHDTGSTIFTLTTTGSGFKENDIAFICDALSSAIFQIYDVSTASGKDEVDHQADNTNMNCGDFLGLPATPTTCPIASELKQFAVNTATPEVRIAPLASSFWYVGNSGSGTRSLYRSKITRSGTGGNTIIMKADEIIPDVQDLQVTYLTRDGTTGTLATNWVAASTITDWADDNTTSQIVAVKLDLTLQTVDKVSTSQAVIQRHLIHVIGLRNREVFVAP